MEMERITLTYTEPSRLLQDWHELEGNPLSDRFKGLRGRGFYDGLCKFLQIRGGGRLQLTLEILYGHAWAVDRPMKSGEVSIPVSQIRRKP
jgi:malonyl-CoA O-methyltransferase